MAHCVVFKGANKIYRGNGGDVVDAAVHSNGVCITTCHELEESELEEIIKTKRIFVSVMSGDNMFPMIVGSEEVVRSVVVDYGKVW